MSTRGFVGILNPDETITAIYNHFDSYFECLGKTLVEEFSEEEKIKALIKRGNGSFVTNEHGYEDETEDEKRMVFKDEKEYIEECSKNVFIEYCYLWKNNQWFGSDTENDLKPLDSCGSPEACKEVK